MQTNTNADVTYYLFRSSPICIGSANFMNESNEAV